MGTSLNSKATVKWIKKKLSDGQSIICFYISEGSDKFRTDMQILTICFEELVVWFQFIFCYWNENYVRFTVPSLTHPLVCPVLFPWNQGMHFCFLTSTAIRNAELDISRDIGQPDFLQSPNWQTSAVFLIYNIKTWRRVWKQRKK